MSETNGKAPTPLFDDGQTITAYISPLEGVHPDVRITYRRWTAGYGRPITAKIDRAVVVNEATGKFEPDDDLRAQISNDALLGRLSGICLVDPVTFANVPADRELSGEALDLLHEVLYAKILLTVKGFKASDPDPRTKEVIPTGEDDAKNLAPASAT